MLFYKKCLWVLVFFSFILIPTTFAQDIFLGKESPFSMRSGDLEVVGKVEGQTFVYHSTSNDYLLDVYDDRMTLKSTIALDFFPKQVEHTKFIALKSHILVFFTAVEKGKAILYGAVLNEKGLLKGKVQTLGEEKTSWWNSRKNYYQVVASEDKSKIMILAKSDTRKGKEFKLMSFTRDLTLIESRKILIEKGELAQWAELNFAQVSNDGKVFIPVFNTTDKGSIQQLSILAFEPTGDVYYNISIMNENDFFSDLMIKLDNTHQICHIGAYQKEKNNGNVKGVFLSAIDMRNNSIKQLHKTDFSEKMLRDIQGKNWKRSLNNAKILQFIIKQDGGYIFISEDQLFTMRNAYSSSYMGYYSYYYNPMLTSTTREYLFGDITMMSFDASGHLEWSKTIRKRQLSQDDEGVFSSFAFMNTGAHLLMFYNTFGNRSNVVTVNAIDPTGLIQTTRINQYVFNNDWYLREAKQIENRTIIVPIISKNKINFARVSF